MYYKQISELGNYIILVNEYTSWIPMNEENTDYQEFLKYLADNQLTIDDIPNYTI